MGKEIKQKNTIELTFIALNHDFVSCAMIFIDYTLINYITQTTTLCEIHALLIQAKWKGCLFTPLHKLDRGMKSSTL